MSRPCPICTSDKQLAIDKDLINGLSHRKIAEAHGFRADQVWRHMAHVKAVIARGKVSISARAEKILVDCFDVLDYALAQRNGRTTQAISAVVAATRLLTLMTDRMDRERAEQDKIDSLSEQQESDFIRYLHTRPDIADDYAVWLRAQRTVVSSE